MAKNLSLLSRGLGSAPGSLLALAAAIIASGMMSTPAAVADCKLPPPVADRIGRVLLFLTNIADKSALVGKYDIIWTDYFYKPQWAKAPGIYSMKYMMAMRDPNPFAAVPNPDASDLYHKTRDLNWYQKNHSDWVLYKCPGVAEPPMCQRAAPGGSPNNPAYSCFYPNSVDHVPLDVSNPEVREFLFNANLGGPPFTQPVKEYVGKNSAPMIYPSILDSGLYDAVSVDNLGDNEFGACGIYRDGRFVRKYSGAKVDPQFEADQVSWLSWLRRKVNTAGACLAGNDYLNADNPRGFLGIASALDIVLDEHGFTRNGRPMETGAAWRTRVNTLLALDSVKPLMIVDYVAPSVADITDGGGHLRDTAGVSWSIANYLLVKGDRTYLALTTDKESGADTSGVFSDLFLKLGPAQGGMQTDNTIYWRKFDNALVVVNPSADTGRFDLGTTRWQDLAGTQRTGNLSLAPGTAAVLTSTTK